MKKRTKLALVVIALVVIIYYILNYTNLGFAIGMGWPFS
jgi:ABC-type uncharacterized transport system permease subunit